MVASHLGPHGRRVRAAAAELLADAPDGVVAVEVNLSCPNHRGPAADMFAHSPERHRRRRWPPPSACGRPRWAKLSPNVADLAPDRRRRPPSAGAEAVTLVNTVLGMAIDPETRRPRLGGGGGGLSGPAIHPVAVRAVYDVHAALPDLPIVGVGGVADGGDAVELLLAGASRGAGGHGDASPTPAASAGCATSWRRGAGATACARVRELIGDAHA